MVSYRAPPSRHTASSPIVALPLPFAEAGEGVRSRGHAVVPTIVTAATDVSRGRHDQENGHFRQAPSCANRNAGSARTTAGKVFAFSSTWYRLVRIHEWRRPRKRIHPVQPKVGKGLNFIASGSGIV